MKEESQGNVAVLRALFRELRRLGVREFCVAAGARNAPIIAALMQRQCGWVVHHFFDERSAAFFALGRTMSNALPTAVITTSGTAAGELLPAMMEAHYQALPLVAITADRPARYRGSGAPQAVEQRGLFGVYAARLWEGEWSTDQGLRIVDEDRGKHGPLHFNACLEEGMSEEQVFLGDESAEEECAEGGEQADAPGQESWEGLKAQTGHMLVLASGLSSSQVSRVRSSLSKLGAPIVAEATSNLRDDALLAPLIVAGGEKALAKGEATCVIRLGAVPSWRWWRDLENHVELPVFNFADSLFRGLARTRNVFVHPLAAFAGFVETVGCCPCETSKGDSSLSRTLDELIRGHPKSEPAWVRALSQLVPAGATVFLGNSLPIREWNLAGAVPAKGTQFYANRGANGIDGLISTGLGVGAEAPECWIIVGDLSALYDASAPWILSQLKNRRWRIVVINNGGGKIFSQVAWLRDLAEPVRAVIENRHEVSFEFWAKQWNLGYRRFDDPALLENDDTPCAVWEIVTDDAQTESFWAAWK